MPASNRSSGSPSEGREPLWSVADVAAYLGIPVNTLYQWRYLGNGPRSYRSRTVGPVRPGRGPEMAQ